MQNFEYSKHGASTPMYEEVYTPGATPYGHDAQWDDRGAHGNYYGAQGSYQETHQCGYQGGHQGGYQGAQWNDRDARGNYQGAQWNGNEMQWQGNDDQMHRGDQAVSTPSRWNPRYWSKKIWAGVAALVVIIIIIVVAVAVTQSKKNSYPDYSDLSYALSETYDGENFFDKFNYFTGYDPAGGFVHYVPEGQAKQLNLTYASADSAVIKVDTSVGPDSNPNASTGRFSVRLESKTTYNKGLFIFDIMHTPYACGAWPALWLTDPANWPNHGEIDVMEAVNQATSGNQMTLHTSSGCSMSVKRKETGDSLQSNCDHSENKNAGCGVELKRDSFGQDFNDNGGGVMAVEWRTAGIRMWQFARSAIPSDITSKKPNPSAWGTAAADFPSTDCNIGSHFKNQSIVANIDLCGSLVYGKYASSKCPSNCTDYVANNPTAFSTAFWQFGGFEVYQSS